MTIVCSFSQNDRVATAISLLNGGESYGQGCSHFVATVLGIDWESANSIMGSNPTYVGINNTYSGLNPGDVVGWPSSGSGHVAIYIGETPNKRFIDVKSNGLTPRYLHGYGPNKLYKSSKY